jgi:hypothetical protein
MTLSIIDTLHNNALHYAECIYAECRIFINCYAECHYTECHYAQCRYAECRGAFYRTPLVNIKKLSFFWRKSALLSQKVTNTLAYRLPFKAKKVLYHVSLAGDPRENNPDPEHWQVMTSSTLETAEQPSSVNLPWPSFQARQAAS